VLLLLLNYAHEPEGCDKGPCLLWPEGCLYLVPGMDEWWAKTSCHRQVGCPFALSLLWVVCVYAFMDLYVERGSLWDVRAS
jgi:hypothetical protein